MKRARNDYAESPNVKKIKSMKSIKDIVDMNEHYFKPGNEYVRGIEKYKILDSDNFLDDHKVLVEYYDMYPPRKVRRMYGLVEVQPRQIIMDKANLLKKLKRNDPHDRIVRGMIESKISPEVVDNIKNFVQSRKRQPRRSRQRTRRSRQPRRSRQARRSRR